MRSVSPYTNVTPETMPKNIQRDGFLLEWDLNSSKYLDRDSLIKWDAAVTPHGLAGFFMLEGRDTADGWLFRIYPQTGSWHKHFDISFKGVPDDKNSVYSASFNSDGTDSLNVTEWVLPWDTVLPDSGKQFYSGFIAVSPSNDTLSAVVLEGEKFGQKKGRVLTPGIIVQMISIAVLLALYLFIRSKAMKKRAIQKKSL